MKNVLYICIGALFAVLAFGSCNDDIDIRQDYDFSLSSWYLQEQIETGETVEIRFYLDREGDYEKAEYEIGYIQMEGKGEVTDSEGVRLVNREVRPLAEVPELDRENPVRQVFTLFYRSTSARRSELKFFVRDNFGQERELAVTFDTVNDTAEE
ncbi:TraQ conjugal transfer family protein [Phocaeicola dorei]|uniref:TraQ conjugal transfer family protein n=1 Tax=Phocaeicola dorei TaxID=357276 RepID=A0AA95HNC0_9BACT|nr:TraQ conjugal transfer family protein [Phocaeicola dorei]